MKKIIALLFLFISILSKAAKDESILLEIGDIVKLQGVKKSLWVENQKIIKALTDSGQIQLKALSIGTTRFRSDKKIQSLTVVPAGQIESFKKWNKLTDQFAYVSIGFCQNITCLQGRISTFQEFKKIINLMNSEKAYIYFGLEINPKIVSEIENWYENYFKSEGINPSKIIFGKPWKVFSTSLDQVSKYSHFFEKIGLQMLEDKSKIESTPNLKVEIKIVEIKKELARQLGVKWPDVYSAAILNNTVTALTDSIQLLLQSSERSGDIKILASPNLMCKSGKEATFFAGGEFPIKVLGEKYSSVSWKQYGINLKIKPNIDTIGQINLEIESEVSTIDKSREVDGVPALHSHKVTSHFDLKKSQTVVLSGLIKSESGNSIEGLPFLSQIPILGQLFSSQSYLENKTELVIFVTPTISGY